MKHSTEKNEGKSAALTSTVGAVLLTLLILGLFTWGEIALQDATGVKRPYTIFYLVPVALGAALLGVRGGIVTALVAVLLARVYLFSDNKHGLELISAPNVAEVVEFIALLAGTLTIAFITGSLRNASGDLAASNENLRQANEKLVESEEQRRVFNRDVLLAVTGGKLRLLDHSEMPPTALAERAPYLTVSLHQPEDASKLRHALARLSGESGLNAERVADLCTATTEAATNAIKHGNGGLATVWAELDEITVQIEDSGTGIAPAHLARATLEQGFSTRVSLGMGFHLMLQSTDTLALCTDAHGTTIFLQVSNRPRATTEEAVLARYTNL